MNNKQIQYAILLAKNKSFSKTAKELKITQPSLSKQILSLEKELGIQLFNRKSIPLTLTDAGEYFLKEAETIIYKENQLKQTMELYKQGKHGKITIGISPFRSLYIMPHLIKELRNKYPYIQIIIKEEDSDELKRKTIEGKYDFSIVNLPINENEVDIIPLEEDTITVAIPNNYLENLSYNKKTNEIFFNELENIPFIVLGKKQEMRILFDKLCLENHIKPNIVLEVKSIATAYTMANSGIGASIIPLQFTNNELLKNSNVKFLKIIDLSYKRQPVIAIKKNINISKYVKFSLNFLKIK